MGVHAAAGATKRGQQQSVQNAVIPAPINGMDARVNLASNNMEVCLYAENLIPSQYGLKVRNGYRIWQEGLGAEVRTIIPVAGQAIDRTADRIFAVTENGIYDVTTSGGSPALKATFADSTGDAGFGVYASYVDGAGITTLFYADGQNGLYVYDELTDTWAVATGINPAPGSITSFEIADIVYVVAHKLRLWFVTKNSNIGWYLPILSSKGDAEEFFFGSKFKHGGELVGLYNWTIDGGAGIDDHLVAISRSGDVIPYKGEDPSQAATWSNIGTFFIGAIPKGNRVCSEYGGDLYMLSTLGITSMTDLLSGGDVDDPFRASIGYKIARLLRVDLFTYGNDQGWNIKFVTSEGILLITVPQRRLGDYRQYAFNMSTQGWGVWSGVPLLTSDPWTGQLMIGTKAGEVGRMDVTLDDIQIDGSAGKPINFSVITSYSDMGSPGLYKRVHQMRPNFLSDLPPTYQCYASYDYSIAIPGQPQEPSPNQGGLWDTGIWEDALWKSGDLIPAFSTQGGSGMGRTVGIVMTGSTGTSTYLGSWDIAWTQGGFL